MLSKQTKGFYTSCTSLSTRVSLSKHSAHIMHVGQAISNSYKKIQSKLLFQKGSWEEKKKMQHFAMLRVIPLFICTGAKIFIFRNCHIFLTIAFPQLGWDPCSLVSCLYLNYLLFVCFLSSVVRLGKDVSGLYPGQVARVHKTYTSRGAPG